MRNPIKLAIAAMVAILPLAAQAQTSPAPRNTAPATPASEPAPQLTPEQMENLQRGVRIMRAFTAAFDSEQVADAVKGRLIVCLYARNLSQISAETGKVFENNPRLDAANASDLYRAAAGVCGISFRPVAAGGDGDAPPVEPAPDGGR
jgi:hypothetical protein